MTFCKKLARKNQKEFLILRKYFLYDHFIEHFYKNVSSRMVLANQEVKFVFFHTSSSDKYLH